MKENNTAVRVKVEEITVNIPEKIKNCLERILIVNPKKQKIFIAENIKNPFAVFVTSNEKPQIIQLSIFPNKKTEEADLSEAILELQHILPDIYPNAEKIIVQIKDNDGVVKQALHDFSIKERIIVYEKNLRKSSKAASLQKIAEEAQKQMNTEKPPAKSPEIPEKTDPLSAASREEPIKTEKKEMPQTAPPPPKNPEIGIISAKISAEDEIIEITTDSMEDRIEKSIEKELRQNLGQFNAAKKMILNSMAMNGIGKPIAAAEFIKNCGISTGILKSFLTVVCKNINRSSDEDCMKAMIIERIIIKFSGLDPETIEIDTEEKQMPSPADTGESENREPKTPVSANPAETAINKPPEIKISPEAEQPKKMEGNPKTIQEKIDIACRRFSLIGLQKSILESLIEKPLSENEIKVKIKTTGNIKGQLLFLREMKLINQAKGGYELNLQGTLVL